MSATAEQQTKCVVLTSSTVSLADQKSHIAKLVQLLNGRRIEFEELDCSLDEHKARRDAYFETSQVRAKYPQVFLEKNNVPTYIGSFEEVEQLNEMCDLPKDFIEANGIATFDTVFANVPRKP